MPYIIISELKVNKKIINLKISQKLLNKLSVKNYNV